MRAGTLCGSLLLCGRPRACQPALPHDQEEHSGVAGMLNPEKQFANSSSLATLDLFFCPASEHCACGSQQDFFLVT